MRNLSALFLTSMVVSVAYGQTSIQGVVKDGSSMTSIPGVTVSIKGKPASTKTDATGKFQINASPTDSLVFNFLGYRSQTVYIGSQTQLSVFLENENQALEEVVVIGYGTQKKADLTGSISSLKSVDITKQPAMSAMQSIQGKAAGLNIVANEAPGSSPNVIIRGLGTALGGRNPLYIVDGIAQTDINNINPSDIESMDVLKDASSASIYGLRAANGVIIVTTKKGKAGTVSINYESYAGLKTVLNKVKMANASQFAQYANEYWTSTGDPFRLAAQQTYDTDWYDELLKTGSVFNNSVNISGGSEKIDYFVSANNFTENGILDGSKYVRNTIRNNNVYKFLNNRLKFSQNLNLTLTNATPKPYGAFNTAYRQAPIMPVRYDNGRYATGYYNQNTGIGGIVGGPGDVIAKLNDEGNPLYEVLRQNEKINTLRLQGSFEGEFKITDYLKINSRIGGNKFYSKQRIFTNIKDRWLNANPQKTDADFAKNKAASPEDIQFANNSLNYVDLEQFRWSWENFLTFNKTFDKHTIEAVLGMSREKYDINSMSSMTGYDVPDKEQYWNINLANNTQGADYDRIALQTYYTPRALASYFGRIQYNYDSKYYLTATLRRDGSSVFRNTGKYWGTFPSVGLGWTVTNEDFMKDVNWINLLKVRGNWGKLGNQDIPLNVSTILQSPESSNYNYVFGPEQNMVFGSAYGTPAKNLSWEVTEETGAGLDFAFLNNNLSGSIDYYHKMNTNAILLVTPTYTSPYEDKFYDHGAKILNQGVEVALNWNKSISPDFSYTVGVNYAYNKNTVKEVKPAYDGDQGGSLNNGELTKQLRVGQPIYGWWMYETNGVFQDEEDVQNYPSNGPAKPGYLKFKDQNEDGIIDTRDRVFFGSFLPTSTYGINIGINYKAIDFNLSGYGVSGNKVYNGLRSARMNAGQNVDLETFENRWTPENPTNAHPGSDRSYLPSNYYLESGSYFRINNITLGYTFNNLYSSKSKLRLYVTAQNPFMFTNYSGFSPELAGDGSPNLTSGIELSAYPTTRNFLFGLNMQF
ncbi:TonB-dependent receptor [Sphingobacterium sp. N143]|uniref:SusC/RagA family TonB-linked outer membrane protein n=1 Tax=Sphingobacterium sp. N143 TaxID=2746727 RepID=UPI0025789479|nr:TonB-dependent receptor [Sphingobacterium sp. N143]MDM1294134.1 TonB-dependent receptor [Sphingobacterium sp. N143]